MCLQELNIKTVEPLSVEAQERERERVRKNFLIVHNFDPFSIFLLSLLFHRLIGLSTDRPIRRFRSHLQTTSSSNVNSTVCIRFSFTLHVYKSYVCLCICLIVFVNNNKFDISFSNILMKYGCTAFQKCVYVWLCFRFFAFFQGFRYISFHLRKR